MNFPFATVGPMFRSPQCSLFLPQLTYPLRPPAGTGLYCRGQRGLSVLGHSQALPAFLAQQSARSLWHTEPSFCLPTLPLFSRDERLPDSQAGHVDCVWEVDFFQSGSHRGEQSQGVPRRWCRVGFCPLGPCSFPMVTESQMPSLRYKVSQAKFPSREDCEERSCCFRVHPGPSL